MDNEIASILAYGEDSLTLWAIQNKLGDILKTLHDDSEPGNCLVFYRPSFGRRGDLGCFGEFDFILLTDDSVYLGESKWDRLTGHVAPSEFSLKSVQIDRHQLMKFYIEERAYGENIGWNDFVELGRERLIQMGIVKPIAPADSDLRVNIEQVLGVIRQRYKESPTISNVLLFLHRGVPADRIPTQASGNFEVVPIDCTAELNGRFIPI